MVGDIGVLLKNTREGVKNNFTFLEAVSVKRGVNAQIMTTAKVNVNMILKMHTNNF